jgi:uroporphyrinogen decarboxylase
MLAGVTEGVPVIHFGTGTATLLGDMKAAGGDVIGLDWRVELGQAWDALGDVAVMGNLDPLTLLAPADVLEREARRILTEAGHRPGHVFNLGHGVLPQTPVDNVVRLVDLVHEVSSR